MYIVSPFENSKLRKQCETFQEIEKACFEAEISGEFENTVFKVFRLKPQQTFFYPEYMGTMVKKNNSYVLVKN